MRDKKEAKTRPHEELDRLRKRVEELERADTDRDRLFDLSLDMLCIAGFDGYFKQVNPAWTAVLGWSEEELLGKPYLDFVHPDDRAATVQTSEDLMAGRPVVSFENRYQCKDGAYRWISWNSYPLPEERRTVAVARDVTERKQQEEALRASERNYREIFNAANDAIFLHDAETGTILDVNRRMLEMFGYSYDEALALSVEDISQGEPPFSEAQAQRWIRRAAVEGPQLFEWHSRKKNGDLFWVEVNLKRLVIDEQNRVVAVVRDITQRKQAEEALEEEHGQLIAIFEATDEVVYVADPETYELLYVNDPVKKRWGDGVGRKCYEVLQNRREPCPFCTNDKIFGEQAGQALIWEFQNEVTKEWFRCIDKAIRWPDGRMVRYEMAINMTERKQAEEHLKLLSSAVEQSSEGIAVTDLNGRLLFANHAVATMHGYESDDLSGEQLSIFHTPEQMSAVNKANKELMETGEFRGEIWRVRRDGSVFPSLMHNSLLRDESGKPVGMIAAMRDITHEVELEAQLRQAHKMEAIGTLAGGIAHDFNNILSVIMGYADLLLTSDRLEDARSRHRADHILNAAKRARDLIKQILTFSRQGEQEAVPIHMATIVKEVFRLLRASLPSTIEIQLNLAAERDVVLADPTEVHQVLMNLCTNAAHAMRAEGGILRIDLTQASVGQDTGPNGDHVAPGTYLELAIGDTGHGIEKDTMERIFEPYFTTKGPGEGTGLGLAVVHGIVKSLGGSITVTSTPQAGTTFRVLLPVADIDTSANVAPLFIPRGRNERILLVDDEEDLVEMQKESLEQLGYRVTGETSSTTALETFCAEADRFDLVITDHTMPTMTGTELARRIMEVKPDMPVILCTGFSELVDPDKVKSLGIREFIMKPLLKADIANAIRRALRPAT